MCGGCSRNSSRRKQVIWLTSNDAVALHSRSHRERENTVRAYQVPAISYPPCSAVGEDRGHGVGRARDGPLSRGFSLLLLSYRYRSAVRISERMIELIQHHDLVPMRAPNSTRTERQSHQEDETNNEYFRISSNASRSRLAVRRRGGVSKGGSE